MTLSYPSWFRSNSLFLLRAHPTLSPNGSRKTYQSAASTTVEEEGEPSASLGESPRRRRQAQDADHEASPAEIPLFHDRLLLAVHWPGLRYNENAVRPDAQTWRPGERPSELSPLTLELISSRIEPRLRVRQRDDCDVAEQRGEGVHDVGDVHDAVVVRVSGV